ncbi:CSS-motif domain-containing protein [Achromobacter sp. GG226]|uniref:CSS-motif domain-containing protein n=1 Tax=Verticiella alkaliphila TaxID=2779529 RepID=UPI001C0E6151|nr:CSS-motif domain-containing protein [Verticiella sp. GG226]MBU4610995.1 CSS-motif domain-containing protein [Verticiella sp. GG226]
MLRTTAWVLSLALAGMVAGAAAGAWLVERQRGQDTREQGRQYTVRADAYSAEALSVLTRVDTSPFIPCSAPDIAHQRTLVLSSAVLKNAGRISPDRHQMCDAWNGVIDPPTPLPPPDYATQRGRRVVTDAPLAEGADARIIMIEQGSANVSLARGTYANLVPPSFDYVVVAYDGATRVEFLRVAPRYRSRRCP